MMPTGKGIGRTIVSVKGVKSGEDAQQRAGVGTKPVATAGGLRPP